MGEGADDGVVADGCAGGDRVADLCVGAHRAAVELGVGADVGAVARAIERLVVDADLRRRMGDAARQRVLAEFDQDRLAARLRDAIDVAVLDGDGTDGDRLDAAGRSETT